MTFYERNFDTFDNEAWTEILGFPKKSKYFHFVLNPPRIENFVSKKLQVNCKRKPYYVERDIFQ